MHRTLLVVLLLGVAPGSAGVASADRLAEPREVARGGYYAPRFAPDGGQLLVTGPKQRGLYLAPLAGGAIRRLTDEAAAGVDARFHADGSVEYRAVRAGTRRDLVIGRDGAVRAAATTSAPIAVAQDDRIYVRSRSGELAQVGAGDAFFSPLVSPDGDKVAFQGLATGLYIYTRSTARLTHVGAGTAPAWSPDGSRLLYELTEDDGHEILASDIYLYDVATARQHRLTATDRAIERRPHFSPDGRQVAFDDDNGGIWLARLEEVSR